MTKDIIKSLEECISQQSEPLFDAVESRLLEVMAESKRLSNITYSSSKSGRCALISMQNVKARKSYLERSKKRQQERAYNSVLFDATYQLRSSLDALKMLEDIKVNWHLSSLFRLEMSVPPFTSYSHHQHQILSNKGYSRLSVGSIVNVKHCKDDYIADWYYRGLSLSNTKINGVMNCAQKHRHEISDGCISNSDVGIKKYLHLKSVLVIKPDYAFNPRRKPNLVDPLASDRRTIDEYCNFFLFALSDNLRFRFMIGLPLLRISEKISRDEVMKLFQTFRLKTHFTLLRSIYLFGNIDAWQAIREFYVHIWLSLKTGDSHAEAGKLNKYRRQQLQMLAQGLVAYFREHFSANASPESREWSLLANIAETDSSASSMSSRFASLLSIDVIYRPPVNIVVTPSSLNTYKDIFYCLFRIQLAKWLSDACWKEGLSARGHKILNLREIKELSSDMNQEEQDRMRTALLTCKLGLPSIFYFVRSVHDLVFVCSSVAWERFNSTESEMPGKLVNVPHAATSILELSRSHSDYLESIHEPLALVMNSVNGLLDVSFEALENFYLSIEIYTQYVDKQNNHVSKSSLVEAVCNAQLAVARFSANKKSLHAEVTHDVRRIRYSSMLAKDQKQREVMLKLVDILSQ